MGICDFLSEDEMISTFIYIYAYVVLYRLSCLNTSNTKINLTISSLEMAKK